MGNLLRKLLRRAIIKGRDLVRQATEERNDEHDHDKDDFAYCWLNSAWMKLLAEKR